MTTASPSTPPLPKLEQLPLEIRHQIYSHLGYPVSRHIWVQCKETQPHRMSRAHTKSAKSAPVHAVPHIPDHGPTYCTTPVELKIRVLSITLATPNPWRLRQDPINAMVLDVALDGYPGLYSLKFEKSLLKVNKRFRGEILGLLFNNVPVVYRFGYMHAYGARPLTVASPLHCMTHITLTGAAPAAHDLLMSRKRMAPRFWVAQHSLTIRHLAVYAHALRCFEYIPSGQDIDVSHLTASQYFIKDLAAAFGELAAKRAETLHCVAVFTSTKSFGVLKKGEGAVGLGKELEKRGREVEEWVAEELWEVAGLSVSETI